MHSCGRDRAARGQRHRKVLVEPRRDAALAASTAEAAARSVPRRPSAGRRPRRSEDARRAVRCRADRCMPSRASRARGASGAKAGKARGGRDPDRAHAPAAAVRDAERLCRLRCETSPPTDRAGTAEQRVEVCTVDVDLAAWSCTIANSSATLRQDAVRSTGRHHDRRQVRGARTCSQVVEMPNRRRRLHDDHPHAGHHRRRGARGCGTHWIGISARHVGAAVAANGAARRVRLGARSAGSRPARSRSPRPARTSRGRGSAARSRADPRGRERMQVGEPGRTGSALGRSR